MSISGFSLEGKVSIVTGGKRGIGKAIALAFAEAGADVVVCSRVVEDGLLDSVAEEIRQLGQRSLAIQTDIRRKTEVDNLAQMTMDEFGGIDILVNNATAIVRKPLLEHSEDDWDRVIDTNLKGSFFCCQAVAGGMIERKRGSIINISSMAALRVFPNQDAYGIVKAAVIVLTRYLARELGGHGIRVNCIVPSQVRTENNQFKWGEPKIRAEIEARVALHRWGEPSEIAAAALFLASDASSYITGASLVADGGYSTY